MINHTRTLLMNLDGQGLGTGPGEEYTPPEFKAVPLPGYLRTIRAILFGRDPDRRQLNFRLRQYMALLHSCELDGDATADDPRVTYLPLDSTFFAEPARPTATPLGGHDFPLYVDGPPPVELGSGRTAYAWQVAVAAGT